MLGCLFHGLRHYRMLLYVNKIRWEGKITVTILSNDQLNNACFKENTKGDAYKVARTSNNVTVPYKIM